MTEKTKGVFVNAKGSLMMGGKLNVPLQETLLLLMDHNIPVTIFSYAPEETKPLLRRAGADERILELEFKSYPGVARNNPNGVEVLIHETAFDRSCIVVDDFKPDLYFSSEDTKTRQEITEALSPKLKEWEIAAPAGPSVAQPKTTEQRARFVTGSAAASLFSGELPMSVKPRHPEMPQP